MKRRNLVIVRAGDRSLHPGWLRGPEVRNWDLVVSYFGDDPAIYRVPDVIRFDAKGPKWRPLHDLILANSALIENYDFIWLPDDDLEMSTGDMNRFFDHCRDHALELAQPSLTVRSPVTHPLVINNPLSRLRFTNFVEVMAPCFSAACLRRVVPTFTMTESGWGIDWLWPRLVSRPSEAIAIVDDVVIRHTRPLGGPNYDAMRAKGGSPEQELAAFSTKHRLNGIRIEFHRILWRSGRLEEVRGRSMSYAFLLGVGYLPALLRSPARKRLLRQGLSLVNRPLGGNLAAGAA